MKLLRFFIFILVLTLFNKSSLFADCLVTGTVNASTLTGCTGTMTIQSGAVVIMNANTTWVASKVIISSGGQIQWTNKGDLILPSNGILIIQSTSPTSGSGAALYGATCNNNVTIFLGSVKYSACTGAGNNCILFSDLVAAGGTAQPTAGVTAGANVSGTNACSPFGLSVTVTGAGTVQSYSWSQTSGPGSSTFSSTSVSSPTINSVTVAGSYTYNVDVVVSNTISNCAATGTVTVSSSITLQVYLPVSATGGGTPQIAAGNPYTLGPTDVSAANYTTVSWTENGAGSITAGGGTLQPTYTSATGDKGNTVTLTMTASNPGCSTTANFTILVRTKLPIETGNQSNCSNNLTWSISNAKNFKDFVVEYSKDGLDFYSIGLVSSQNESRDNTQTQTYKFNDKAQHSKSAYYRLKLIDNDGSYSWSNVIAIQNQCLVPTAQLSPNPLKNAKVFNVELFNFGNQIKGNLVDVAGRSLGQYALTNGSNHLTIQSVIDGVYWLQIKDENGNGKTLMMSVISR